MSNTLESNTSSLIKTTNKEVEKLPNAPVSDNTYDDFVKILKGYLKELKMVNLNNSKLNQDDLLVLDDLIKESSSYIIILSNNTNIKEYLDLIEYTNKIVNLLLIIFNNMFIDENLLSNDNILKTNCVNQIKDSTNNINSKSVVNKLLAYPFILKIILLESKLNAFFETIINISILQNTSFNDNYSYNDFVYKSKIATDEIYSICNNLNFHPCYISSAYYYVGCLELVFGNYETSKEIFLNKCLNILEQCSNSFSKKDNLEEFLLIDDTSSQQFKDNVINKLSYVLKLIGELYEYIEEDLNNAYRYYEKGYYLNFSKTEEEIINEKDSINSTYKNENNSNINSYNKNNILFSYFKQKIEYCKLNNNKILSNKDVSEKKKYILANNIGFNKNTNKSIFVNYNKLNNFDDNSLANNKQSINNLVFNSSVNNNVSYSNNQIVKKINNKLFICEFIFTQIYLPYMIKLYNLNNELKRTLYFDKTKLIEYFKINKNKDYNSLLYNNEIYNL